MWRKLILFGVATTQILSLSACSMDQLGTVASTRESADDIVTRPPTETYKSEPLLWEGSHPDASIWSAYAHVTIQSQAADALLPGALDVASFCPNYSQLDLPEQVNFWAYLISAVAKYESEFDPHRRRLRSRAGVDQITGQATFGEGLLQLSYGETRRYSACRFDWEKDKKLRLNDPRRSILDPFKNLECGIQFLAKQVSETGQIAESAATLWTSLLPQADGGHLEEIQKMTSQLGFCEPTETK
ncbi:MAG: hypothetical protein AB7G93_09770 [Bdellovibrionales bacterium]